MSCPPRPWRLQSPASIRYRDLHGIHVSEKPDHPWFVFAEIHDEAGGSEERIFAYWDQYRGRILGQHPADSDFFQVVLTLHRTLFAGAAGRIVVETATCWGIVSMLSGLYLWWPRRKERVWGVWLPRVSGGMRTVLRDWHTVPGMYLSFAVLAIMLTGLLFTTVWGSVYHLSNALTGGYPDFYLSPPQSVGTGLDGAPARLPLDRVWTIAHESYPFEGRRFSLNLPHAGTDEAFSVITDISEPFADLGAVFIDQRTGKVLVAATGADLPLRAHLTLLFYPIHVGSIFGRPTQVLAVLACVIVIAMSLTGVWMWWRRRPSGGIGAPRKPPGGTVPPWIAWLTVFLAVFLPTVGLTLLLVAVVGQLSEWWRRWRGKRPSVPAA